MRPWRLKRKKLKLEERRLEVFEFAVVGEGPGFFVSGMTVPCLEEAKLVAAYDEGLRRKRRAPWKGTSDVKSAAVTGAKSVLVQRSRTLTGGLRPRAARSTGTFTVAPFGES